MSNPIKHKKRRTPLSLFRELIAYGIERVDFYRRAMGLLKIQESKFGLSLARGDVPILTGAILRRLNMSMPHAVEGSAQASPVVLQWISRRSDAYTTRINLR